VTAPAPKAAPRRIAVVAASGAVAAFGLGNAMNKMPDVSAVTLAFWRAWLGVPVLLTILVLSGGRPSVRMFVRTAEAGVSFGVQIVLFFSAIHATSVTNATAVAALQPVLVMAAAWRWLGERFTARDVALAVAALAGVLGVVVAGPGAVGGGLDGDLMAAGALVLWAHYYLAVKRIRQSLSAFEVMAGVLTVAAVVITPYALVTSDDLGAMDGTDWAWCAAIVLVPGALGHLLTAWAAHELPVSLLSQLTLGIPVIAVAGAAVLVGETVTAGQVVAIAFALVMLGLLLRSRVPRPGAPATRSAAASAAVAAAASASVSAAAGSASGAAASAGPTAFGSEQEVAELPGIAAVEPGVVPAEERVHP
jgi:drug/metabolite transporter (DMT)-like permease